MGGHALPVRLQDLAPPQARFCLDVERFLKDILPPDLGPDPRFLVAFSHGADSTALLLALYYLAPRLGARLAACHLDHGLRPESASEAAQAAAFCAALDIDCHVSRTDVAALAVSRGLGLEQAGREARYAFFEQARAATGSRLTCLAHTLDDLAEDVVLRLTRGVGWPALGGMAAADPARRLARPLLMTTRARIEDFLTGLCAPWITDPSNATADFRRNRIRHGVIPQLAAENPHLDNAIARLWRLARLDQDYWERQVEAILPPHVAGTSLLAAAALRAAHPALRLRAYKAALDRLGPGESRAGTLFELDQAFADRRIGKVFKLPGNKRARITAAGVEITREPGADCRTRKPEDENQNQ